MRFVPEGVPFYRAKGRSAVCPSCRTPIRRNKNSTNESLFSIEIIAVVFLVLAGLRLSVWAGAGAFAFIAASIARTWHTRRFLKEWKYWEVNEHAR
jgi:hypothetical protein